jgi:hypothetical protein
MTELSHSPDDEIVSAVLDGEATADEQARVDADPDLQRRLAELARARDQVAVPVAPLDELTARRLVDRAIREAGVDAPHGRPAAIRDEAPWWRRGVGIGLGSAAALVVVALLVGPALVGGLGSSDDDSGADVAATAADEPNPLLESLDARGRNSITAEGEAEMFADDAGGADEQAEAASGAGGPWVVQTHATVDHFVASLREQATPVRGTISNPPSPTTTTYGDRVSEPLDELRSRCDLDLLDVRLDETDVTLQVQAQVGDQRLLGFAISTGAEVVVVIVDPATCEVVASD